MINTSHPKQGILRYLTGRKRPIRANLLVGLNSLGRHISICALNPKKLTGPRAELYAGLAMRW